VCVCVCIADCQATILVKGISVNDTDSSLKLFFENERRNGGGRLANDMIINRDLQAAVVTFEQEEGLACSGILCH
jgi:hypothetical protein